MTCFVSISLRRFYMRKLTVKREKKYVASLSRVNLYLQDTSSVDTFINGVPCRHLGDLKNGEEKSFDISDESARLYACYSKRSRNQYNDFYPIPAGEDDVNVSGRSVYSVSNPFLFNNNESEEVASHRKAMKKKAIIRDVIITLVCFVIGFVIGFASSVFSTEPKTFEYGDLSIVLTDDFREEKLTEDEKERFDVVYSSYDTAVIISSETFEQYPALEGYTLSQYCDSFILANDISAFLKETTFEDGLAYLIYEVDIDGDMFRYVAFVYNTDDAFWVVQITAHEDDFDDNFEDYIEYAKSVKFKGE